VSPLPTDRLRALAAEYSEADLVVLFGSVARGEPASWSDADVAVSGLAFWRALELGSRLAGELGREPHVVDLAEASDWLRFRIASDGVLLHQGQPTSWPRFVAGAMLRYFDLAPIIALCADGARRALVAGGRDG
jgi:predicted nucleotidyltransferase